MWYTTNLVQFLIGPLGLFADEAKEKFFRIFFVLGVKNSTNFANFLLGEIHQIFINKKLNTQKKIKKFPPLHPLHNYPIPRDAAHGWGRGCGGPHWTR